VSLAANFFDSDSIPNMTEEESKDNLREIFGEIDKNGDGKLYPEELKAYIGANGKYGEVACDDDTNDLCVSLGVNETIDKQDAYV